MSREPKTLPETTTIILPDGVIEEPNRKSWEHAGLPCRICRVDETGHFCGYVGVPAGHILYRKYWQAELPEVAAAFERRKKEPVGNISPLAMISYRGVPTLGYLLKAHGGVNYSRGYAPWFPETEGAGFWYVGFDCAHYGDWSPRMSVEMQQFCVYRDIEYVTMQVDQLAEQLAALATDYPGPHPVPEKEPEE